MLKKVVVLIFLVVLVSGCTHSDDYVEDNGSDDSDEGLDTRELDPSEGTPIDQVGDHVSPPPIRR